MGVDSFGAVSRRLSKRGRQGHTNSQNMRQLHTFIASKSAKKAKIEARPTPKGPVDTTPGHVHSRFRRQFYDFDQKRQTVDMWTRSVLIINKGQCPQDCPPHPANPSKTILSSFCPPLAHWGEPFHCPRQGVRYSSGGCGLSPSMQRDAEGRRSQRVKRKDKVRRRGKSKVGGILEEAVVAK